MSLSIQDRQALWHARHRLNLYRAWKTRLINEAFERDDDNDGSEDMDRKIREAADDLDELCEKLNVCGHMDCMEPRGGGSLFCDRHRRP